MTKSESIPFELKSGRRIISLDAFRGLTIAGMILVNDPGSWSYIYDPLEHAEWHGITPTDLVFPFFIFIVGVSVALVYTKLLKANNQKRDMIRKLIVRSLWIFGFGVFFHAYPKFFSSAENPFLAIVETLIVIAAIFVGLSIWKSNWKLSGQTKTIKYILWAVLAAGLGIIIFRYDGFVLDEFRIPGVLQRIAIVYFICSLLFLYSGWKTQAIIGAVLLLGYWVVMTMIPTPGIGEVLLEPGKNLAAWFDSVLLPGAMYRGQNWDPEGVLSTVPSIVTGISGMLVGTLITSETTTERKLIWLFSAGFIAFLIGGMWDWFFPINKHLWTSSFVMYTSGAASMGLAMSIWFVDILGYKKWTKFAVIFGSNALTAYLLHGLLNDIFFVNFGTESDVISINSTYFTGLVGMGLVPEMVSLIWALLYVLVCFFPIWWLYKRKIFIKV